MYWPHHNSYLGQSENYSWIEKYAVGIQWEIFFFHNTSWLKKEVEFVSKGQTLAGLWKDKQNGEKKNKHLGTENVFCATGNMWRREARKGQLNLIKLKMYAGNVCVQIMISDW